MRVSNTAPVENFSACKKRKSLAQKQIVLPHCDITFSKKLKSRSQLAQHKKSHQIYTPLKSMNTRIFDMNRSENIGDQQKYVMKWIGVFRKDIINDSSAHNQAFPKRSGKNIEHSFHNFILKYGRTLKKPKQMKQINKIYGGSSSITNAATIKVKPRLTWYQKRSSPTSFGNESAEQLNSKRHRRRTFTFSETRNKSLAELNFIYSPDQFLRRD